MLRINSDGSYFEHQFNSLIYRLKYFQFYFFENDLKIEDGENMRNFYDGDIDLS
jgi:hypothetical protein